MILSQNTYTGSYLFKFTKFAGEDIKIVLFLELTVYMTGGVWWTFLL